MKKQNILLAILIIFLAALGIASIKKINKQSSKTNNENINQIANIKYNQEEKSPPASLSANKTMNKPAMIIDQNKNYEATLHTTAGDIVLALNAAVTPITVNNFVYLAKNNFYDNTTFHRVINGFMIQGGDQRGDGTGSPGYQFDDEVFEGEYTRGTIAMANSGPNTNGSQFFIMQQDYALPHNYVIFGKVISGMEVVDQIAAAKVTNNFSGELSKPVEPVVVTSIDIEEK
jgi:cyclophilin family peptidyl-prolyl cis-trans isomerase